MSKDTAFKMYLDKDTQSIVRLYGMKSIKQGKRKLSIGDKFVCPRDYTSGTIKYFTMHHNPHNGYWCLMVNTEGPEGKMIEYEARKIVTQKILKRKLKKVKPILKDFYNEKR